MKSFVVALVLISASCAFACDGTPNTLPIFSGDPTFVREVPNGKLYQTGGPNLSPPLLVAHVWGTPYEMGFAHGQLLKDEINTIFPQFLQYVYNEIDRYIQFLPPALRQLIEEYGVEAIFELTEYLTKPFTPQHFIEEVQGLAAATNMTYSTAMGITLFPEIIQAACSMMGAYGQSIAQTNGTLYQMRALDWSTDTPLQQYPLVLVYHPNDGHAFTTVTWAGFVGAITGYSSSDVAICEKVWYAYSGKQNRAGQPWHFLLRDILQFDANYKDAMNRILNNTRTCAIWVGIGDSKPSFHVVQYSYETVESYGPMGLPNHTNFQDLVYVDKHVQPSHDTCMPELIQKYYGALHPQNIITHVTAEFQTGDMHIAVFDYSEHLMYVSNAGVSVNGTEGEPAYNRPFTQLDLDELFSEQPPDVNVAVDQLAPNPARVGQTAVY